MNRYPRRPIVGTLPAREIVAVGVSPGISDDMRPVVFSAHGGAIVIRSFTAFSVTLENKSSAPVAYVLVFAPRAAVELGLLPWRQIAHGARVVFGKLRELLK